MRTTLLLILLLTACAGGRRPPALPPLLVSGVPASSAAVAAIGTGWAQAAACWEYTGPMISVVLHRAEQRDRQGQCGFVNSWGVWCYGYAFKDEIHLCEDGAAARHEFSHAICERLTGKICQDGYGRCWL